MSHDKSPCGLGGSSAFIPQDRPLSHNEKSRYDRPLSALRSSAFALDRLLWRKIVCFDPWIVCFRPGSSALILFRIVCSDPEGSSAFDPTRRREDVSNLENVGKTWMEFYARPERNFTLISKFMSEIYVRLRIQEKIKFKFAWANLKILNCFEFVIKFQFSESGTSESLMSWNSNFRNYVILRNCRTPKFEHGQNLKTLFQNFSFLLKIALWGLKKVQKPRISVILLSVKMTPTFFQKF